MRTIGTVVRGVRAPIIREGDNIAEVAAASVMEAWKEAGIEPRDRDVVAVTESVVARAQGNYATLDQIAKDVREKTGGGTVGVAFPILSRNRFSLLLRGMAMGCKKIVLLLSYPSDEVGNGLVDWDKLDEAGVDPYSDVLTLEQFREKFGAAVHPFTGVDYIDFYSGIITDAGAEVEVIFGNRVQTLCDYTDAVITCDIHTRARSKRLLKALAPAWCSASTICSTEASTAAATTPNTDCSAPTRRPRRPLSSSRATAWPLPRSWARDSARPAASTSRPWSTVTVRSKTPSARSGSSLTPSSPPATPRALSARRTS